MRALKPLLLTAIMCVVVLGGQSITTAQHVTLPRESSTPEIEGPKSSRGKTTLETIIRVLTEIACKKYGECPQTTSEPAEKPSPDPQGLDGGRRPAPMEPYSRPEPARGFSYHVPPGWRAHEETAAVTVAPSSEYINGNLTNGVMFGLNDLNGATFEAGTERYIRGVLSVNKYLRRVAPSESSLINGVSCLTTYLEGLSPQTQTMEKATVYTCRRSSQQLFYVVNVTSGPNAHRYEEQNSRITQSISFR